MIKHINSERRLNALDRNAEREFTLDFSNPEPVSMANRSLDNTSQMGAEMLVQIYKENPQIRAAMNNNVEEISMDAIPLPGQISFGVSPSAVSRINEQSRKAERDFSPGM